MLIATVLGSTPASSDTVEYERRQKKQCWIKYIKNPPKSRLLTIQSKYSTSCFKDRLAYVNSQLLYCTHLYSVLKFEVISRQLQLERLPRFSNVLKPTSWTYDFVKVSGHNIESSQTWGFRIQYLHYKPVSTTIAHGGGGGERYNPLVEVTVNSKSRENS